MQADFIVSAKEWQAKNRRRLEIEGHLSELQDKAAALEEQSKHLQDEWNELTLWMKAAGRLEPQLPDAEARDTAVMLSSLRSAGYEAAPHHTGDGVVARYPGWPAKWIRRSEGVRPADVEGIDNGW